MSQQQQSQKRARRKGNDKEDGEWKCLDCCKSYLSYPAFYTHCKTKHESKWPAYYNTPRPLDEIKRDRGRPRTNQDEQRQHEKEDQIFEFLGKLGQNNEEVFSNINIKPQKEDSQNNCIRHYLKQPIHPVTQISNEIFLGKVQETIYKEVFQYLEKLNIRVVEQELIWDFRDPLSFTNELEEFTFSNLKGLFYQLENEKAINLISVISVFLGWLSRHLKKKSYQDVVIVVILIAQFMRNFKDLDIKDIDPKDKNSLMRLKDNDQQEVRQFENFKQSEKKEEPDSSLQQQDKEKDIKQTLITQASFYIVKIKRDSLIQLCQEKCFPEFELQISYLKGCDIAQGFVSLVIDWIDAFADLETLLDIQLEKQL